jgi:hypothetical protein
MIIRIDNSKLFTVDPDTRFAREYNLPKGTWNELWKRYKLLDYSMSEVCALYRVKTGRQTNAQSMKRWIFRTEVYSRAKEARKLGARAVNSSYFGENEGQLLKEVFKNKSSVKCLA